MSTTEQNNEFTFVIDGLSKVNFLERDHSISKDQPYGGVSCSGKTVTIKAGRHKTDKVAEWFNTATAGGGGIALTYSDTAPEKLNFAVRGTLTLVINGVTYTAQDFILAQGSASSGDNNWWLGSAQMSGITHSNVDMEYATSVVKSALSFVVDIVTENPEGFIKDTAGLIVTAVKKHKVGSGEVPFLTSRSSSEVELLLFQMSENHETHGSLTGTYSNPN